MVRENTFSRRLAPSVPMTLVPNGTKQAINKDIWISADRRCKVGVERHTQIIMPKMFFFLENTGTNV